MQIRTPAELEALSQDLRSLGSFALDTEFIREKTYRPQLCLVQIAAAGKAYVIDPFLTTDLRPLLDLVFDPGVEKIVHAGEQDMEIFFTLGRKIPRRVFDTQVAAALAGRGESISYARLIEELAGVKLSKVETFTDWSKRPLRPEQIEYALDDVRYLHAAKEALEKDLTEQGRLDWLADELSFYEERTLYEKDATKLYLKIRSAAKLEPKELAVLRELAAWREEEAQEMDWPRGRILLDEALVELARRSPSNPAGILAVRGIHPQLVKRSGAEILRRVALAKALPPEQHPPPLERRSLDAELALVVDFLELVLRARAAEVRIAPAYLASRKELTELARRTLRGAPEPDAEPLPLLTGWRRRLAGEALINLLQGKSHAAIDVARARVEVMPRTT